MLVVVSAWPMREPQTAQRGRVPLESSPLRPTKLASRLSVRQQAVGATLDRVEAFCRQFDRLRIRSHKITRIDQLQDGYRNRRIRAEPLINSRDRHACAGPHRSRISQAISLKLMIRASVFKVWFCSSHDPLMLRSLLLRQE